MKSNHVISRSSLNRKNAKENSKGHQIGSLHLRNISANHNGEILNNISLQLKPGNLYGFAGNMEKRKLLIALIHGTVKPTKGKILINNNIDIGNVDDWPSYVTRLKKETRLFSEAIAGASRLKEKKAAGSMATSLLDAAARTFLKSSPVVLIDEAMASLSIEWEEQLLRQICLNNRDRIVILNTSRPDSLKYCDHIFLVKNNKISEVSKQTYFTDFSGIFRGFSGNYYSKNIF